MKKAPIILLASFIIISSISNLNAQTLDTIYVPDENLRYILVKHDSLWGTDYGMIDNRDGTISMPNISIVDSLIIKLVAPENFGIDDFTGLENFTSLKYFEVFGEESFGEISFLDNSEIREIILNGAWSGSFRKVTLINCIALESFQAISTGIEHLYLENCHNLSALFLRKTNVGSSEITNCDSLTSFSFDSDGGFDHVNISECDHLDRISAEYGGSVEANNCALLTTISMKHGGSVLVSNCSSLKYIIVEMSSHQDQEININNCLNLEYLRVREGWISKLDLSDNSLLTYLNTMRNPMPIVYIPEIFNATVEKEDYTQLAVLRDTAFNPTIPATQTGAYELDATGTIVNMVDNNGQEGSLLASTQSDPTIIGSLPVGVKTIRSEEYWIIEESGLSDYEYNLILDLSSIDSLDVDSCEVLCRPNNSSPWERVTDLADTVETVAHFKIINGLAQFGEFAVSDNTEPVSIEKEEEIIPATYSLEQNYPNPFNPSTTISFALPYRANVKLRVFNNRGELITELVNGEMAAGYHNEIFNSASAQLSSGIYYYQLRAESSEGSFVQTRKLVLLK